MHMLGMFAIHKPKQIPTVLPFTTKAALICPVLTSNVLWFSQFLRTPRTILERPQTSNGTLIAHRVHIPTSLFHCVKPVVFRSIIPNIIIFNCLFKFVTIAIINNNKQTSSYVIRKNKLKSGHYVLVFVIVHVRCCPALMVPTQSPENEGRKERGTKTSRTTKSPGFTVTD